MKLISNFKFQIPEKDCGVCPDIEVPILLSGIWNLESGINLE